MLVEGQISPNSHIPDAEAGQVSSVGYLLLHQVDALNSQPPRQVTTTGSPVLYITKHRTPAAYLSLSLALFLAINARADSTGRESS